MLGSLPKRTARPTYGKLRWAHSEEYTFAVPQNTGLGKMLPQDSGMQ